MQLILVGLGVSSGSTCETKMDKAEGYTERPIYKDIRRYYCEYCGICRSKKALLTSHVDSQHKEEMEKASKDRDCEEADGIKSNTCKECGASFKKLAHLIQHMQSHSLEREALDPRQRTPKCMRQLHVTWWISIRQGDLLRSSIKGASVTLSLYKRPYVCAVDDCCASYKRKDHLNRHLLQHQGKTFKCPVENCGSDFVFQGNMTRHVKEFHNGNSSSARAESHKLYVCPESGCGKVFKYASKLQKHENSHVKLDSTEALCLEPGCLKHFTNVQCLKAHIKSCHRYVTCETCWSKQLKKNIKRHLRVHETSSSTETFKCEYEGCCHTFSSKSNLHKHEKAVHFEDKPFVCGFPNCGMRFSYKHVRDNHEKTGLHVYALGDFVEADDQFRSRPRGGRKRKCPTVEMLVRKRVTPPSQLEQCLFMEETEQN